MLSGSSEMLLLPMLRVSRCVKKSIFGGSRVILLLFCTILWDLRTEIVVSEYMLDSCFKSELCDLVCDLWVPPSHFSKYHHATVLRCLWWTLCNAPLSDLRFVNLVCHPSDLGILEVVLCPMRLSRRLSPCLTSSRLLLFKKDPLFQVVLDSASSQSPFMLFIQYYDGTCVV